MKRKLFGMNINPDCTYCVHSDNEQDFFICKKGRKKIVNGKCRKFKYDPLLRVPKKTVNKTAYTEEDFKL